MTTVHSFKDIKEGKPSAKIAILAMLLIPLAGIGCLLFPQYVEAALPWLLGLPMVLSALSSIIAAVRAGKVQEGRATLGSALVMLTLGFIVIIHGTNNTLFIGVIWGLLGLVKAAHEFDGIFHDIKNRDPFIIALAMCVFELVLAVLLILNPYANIEHHLLLLGIQLIIYPFKLQRDHGKLKIEAEA